MSDNHCADRVHPGPLTTAVQVLVVASAITLCFTSTAFATSWETTSLRAPGGGLIRVGMTRQDVIRELGSSSPDRRSPAAGESAKPGRSMTHRGDDGLYTITFSGERVVKIIVTPKRD